MRELGALTLEAAVQKMSAQAAQAMHLDDRGRVAVGHAADLVVFDAKRVADRATFAEPMQTPVGIQHVLVSGVAVLTDGAPTGKQDIFVQDASAAGKPWSTTLKRLVGVGPATPLESARSIPPNGMARGPS